MLSFTHAGNRLSSMRAWDGANHPQTDTFTYDAMGNQLTDSRKGLQFSYNLANLPCKVEGMAGSANAGLTLSYGYLADGTKTSSVTNQGEGLKYRGSFVYEIGGTTDCLSSIAWSEGRVALEYGIGGTIPEIRDEWHICDHLGNTRVVVDMTNWGTVVEQNEYLPFGTRIANPSSELTTNRYRLAGKEEQRFGIGAGTLDLHLSDFGARYYDPFTARWTTPDPLAGKYVNISPYVNCHNNPVNYVDLDGRDTVLVRDIPNRPLDRGISGETYTAEITVIHNGEIKGVYRGSSYPNSKSNNDNSTTYNTVKEGEYDFNNLYGHSRGTEKGLNLVNEYGERKVPAFSSTGEDTEAVFVNVHSGKSDLGNYNSRGSKACITIHPDDSESFFSNFSWTNTSKTTGNSTGRIIITRTNKNQ